MIYLVFTETIANIFQPVYICLWEAAAAAQGVCGVVLRHDMRQLDRIDLHMQ